MKLLWMRGCLIFILYKLTKMQDLCCKSCWLLLCSFPHPLKDLLPSGDKVGFDCDLPYPDFGSSPFSVYLCLI